MNNELLIKLLKKRLLLHVFFWLVFAGAFSLGWAGAGFSWRYILINYLGTLLIYFSYVYATLYLAYGYFIPRKNYLASLLVFIGLLIAATQVSAWLYNISNEQGKVISFQNFLPFYVFLAAFTLALKIARTAYLTLAREIELKEELLNQKEYFLRSQIHPHFLFNTLNNFYGLALEKSDALPGLMIHLSNILRHQIYHSESPYISLEKEINYLKDYIELEKIRHAENLSFQFWFPENIPSDLYVMPSVLIVFFENAFKHSNNISSQLIAISGNLNVENDEMRFNLENTFPDKSFPNHEKQKGLGLNNVKKRLALLGEENHTLSMKKENGKYSVSLTMKLKKQ
ncbi:MAG: histidine kinase [Bacteroidetes bacterium]|nr:histidine kinase [Bacteroidota bacterium]